jgi:hypothetical protein
VPIYTYESKDGDRIERISSWQDSPCYIRANGKRYGRIITATAKPVIENVAGVHHGPGEPTIIRNKHDIREPVRPLLQPNRRRSLSLRR